METPARESKGTAPASKSELKATQQVTERGRPWLLRLPEALWLWGSGFTALGLDLITW